MAAARPNKDGVYDITSQSTARPRRPPATTPEARENQLVDLAFEVAEEQLLNRDASAQVITHFLKLGSEREKTERKRLELELELTRAKIDSMESSKRLEQLYDNAIKAMRDYSGQEQLPPQLEGGSE